VKKEQISPTLFWIGLSIFVGVLSYRMGLGTFKKPGPGLMPFSLGVLLCLISLYLLIRALVQRSRNRCEAADHSQRGNLGKIALVVLSIFVYALVLQKLGYLIATALLLFVLFYAAGTKTRIAAISSLITTLASYFGFTYLGLIFPPGILKFLGVY
jgi:putative tricarboxylic transport membrane protein